MDEKIEPAPALLQGLEGGIDGGDILDIAGQDEVRADAGRQRLDALAERLALIGEGEFRTMRGERLGDAPGNRILVRDPHDEAALSGHEAHGDQASRRFMTIVALVPPKPKEFDSTQPKPALSTRWRTIGMSATAGSSSSIWALWQTKSLLSMSSE